MGWLKQFKHKSILKSPWLLHYDAGCCNGCDIEILATLTPLYDVERFGIIPIGNPKQADLFLVTGPVNYRNRRVLRRLYDQMPHPKIVVAVGTCASTGGVFHNCYNILGGVDQAIPVDVYVPGCAVRPESILEGVMMGLARLEAKMRGGSLEIDPNLGREQTRAIQVVSAALTGEPAAPAPGVSDRAEAVVPEEGEKNA